MEEWQNRENETRKERGQITLLDCQKRWNPQNVETLKSGNVEDQKSGICGNPEIRKSRNPEVSGTVPDSSGISAADIRNSARIFRMIFSTSGNEARKIRTPKLLIWSQTRYLCAIAPSSERSYFSNTKHTVTQRSCTFLDHLIDTCVCTFHPGKWLGRGHASG